MLVESAAVHAVRDLVEDPGMFRGVSAQSLPDGDGGRRHPEVKHGQNLPDPPEKRLNDPSGTGVPGEGREVVAVVEDGRGSADPRGNDGRRAGGEARGHHQLYALPADDPGDLDHLR